MTQSTIVLATDFGIEDTFVGVMKGVISYYAPRSRVIDLTHHIRPQDIVHGSYSLRIAFPYFPKQTIFVCVVDPGVGSERSAIALKASDKLLVLPNNGLCSLILNDYDLQEAVYLSNAKYHLSEVSSTFHGRDIFSPVAAHLASGVPLEKLGSNIEPKDIIRLNQVSNTLREDGAIQSRIIHVDHFGNCITAIQKDSITLEAINWKVRVKNTEISSISKTYSDVSQGELLAYFGSDGFLEIALRNGNASQALGASIGETIQLIPVI